MVGAQLGAISVTATGHAHFLIHMQATLVMKTMIPSLPLPVALGYGAPFPNHTHKAAVVRAPRLGACAIMSAGMLTQIRETQLVKVLEAAVPSKELSGICCVCSECRQGSL